MIFIQKLKVYAHAVGGYMHRCYGVCGLVLRLYGCGDGENNAAFWRHCIASASNPSVVCSSGEYLVASCMDSRKKTKKP